MHEGLDESELLLVALGERADRSVEVGSQPRGEVVDPPGRNRTADLCEVPQQRPAAHAPLEPQIAGHIADATAQVGSADAGDLAEDASGAGSGSDDVDEESQRGRLSGTVRDDQSETGAGVTDEVGRAPPPVGTGATG